MLVPSVYLDGLNQNSGVLSSMASPNRLYVRGPLLDAAPVRQDQHPGASGSAPHCQRCRSAAAPVMNISRRAAAEMTKRVDGSRRKAMGDKRADDRC